MVRAHAGEPFLTLIKTDLVAFHLEIKLGGRAQDHFDFRGVLIVKDKTNALRGITGINSSPVIFKGEHIISKLNLTFINLLQKNKQIFKIKTV